MRDETIAGILARFQANFDPHRHDAASAEVALGTWSEQLWAVDDSIGTRVADLILSDPERSGRDAFPTVGEFRQLCQRLAAHAADNAPGDEQGVCLTCQGDKVLFTETTSEPLVSEDGRELRPAITYEFMQPCPMCCPDEWQYLKDGHWAADHRVKDCDHPRCQRRAEQYAKTRHR